MTENKRFIYNKFDISGNFEGLKLYEIDNNPSNDLDESNLFYVYSDSEVHIKNIVNKLNVLIDENEQLKQENERIKKALDTHLNKSYIELNKFKSLKNPSNPERVRKQIIIRDAEIMLLVRILKEIDCKEQLEGEK